MKQLRREQMRITAVIIAIKERNNQAWKKSGMLIYISFLTGMLKKMQRLNMTIAGKPFESSTSQLLMR